MQKNMGQTDRVIRLIIAIILALWGIFIATGVWAGVLYTLGVVMLVTGLIGTCPLYMPFHISTNKK
ncbi:membrane protein [Dehalogenimonas sp. WBC-2]|nr:membrane protein [Dehalogenimonas sp. WBC-2]